MRTLSLSESWEKRKTHRVKLPRIGSRYRFLYDDDPAREINEEIAKRGGNILGVAENSYFVQIYDDLTHLQQSILKQHAKDVATSAKERDTWSARIKSNPTNLLFVSTIRLLFRNFILLCGQPLSFITRPFDTLYEVLFFGTVYTALFFSNWLFLLFKIFRVRKWVSNIGHEHGDGLSVINWANIIDLDTLDIFTRKRDVFSNARATFAGNFKSYVEDRPGLDQYLEESDKPLKFDIDVARAILLMCAVVYERNTAFVQKAAEASLSHNIPNEELVFLLKSEEPMLRIADEWGLDFIAIADFRSLSGPFIGAFYQIDPNVLSHDQQPYIVLVVKGTSLDAFGEWVMDATASFESCSDFLGAGMAHEGFYDALFPAKNSGQKLIEEIAGVAWRDNAKKTNLFIGGHSLGAGIASLLYARMLESPEDLGDKIVLRDAYTFGTPRVCDAKLASRFDYNLNRPVNRGRQLWRVANRSRSSWVGDIVTHVPPGYADNRELRGALQDASYFSYAAIGIRLRTSPHTSRGLRLMNTDLEEYHQPNGRKPFHSIDDTPVGFESIACKSEDEAAYQFSRFKEESQYNFPRDLVQLSMEIVGTFLPFVHDHFPASYLEALDRMHGTITIGEKKRAAREQRDQETQNRRSKSEADIKVL
ncbi:lipase class 3 [Melampsora larici-populina 98AG31]|uniref:Lipase class 3 n=1 Tax=Melampsora larici-populina (strain 98AG31 / pathotype 3-4-7) TaxID=747676 RepID=F4RLD3_MELLP|nr:lipase class 3 [Melampsora larici-populina 98AG31]EGG06888.1 lipase class 3 [Melampsora larici-populina 98AG31]